MKRAGIILSLILIGMVVLATQLSGITADEIIKKMEANQVFKTSFVNGRMEISDDLGKRTKTFTIYSQGTDNTMMEFTNIEEKGQRILRIKNAVYLYYPNAEEIITIQGDALKDKIMGSDFSYEDMTGGKDLLSRYKLTLAGEEQVDGFACYKIVIEAKVKDAVYPKQEIWVDKQLFTYRKVVSYALSDRAVKEMKVTEIKTVDGKNVPVHFIMQDSMKKSSKTEFIISEIKIGIKIDPGTFSFEELTW